MTASKHRIYFLLQTAAARLKKSADRELLDRAGISVAQAAVLAIVKEEAAVSQKTVSEQLSQRESAITTMVSRLTKAGLIMKSRSDTDGRAWQIRITEEGKRALRKAERVFASINADLDRSLTRKQISDLAASLKKIADRGDT